MKSRQLTGLYGYTYDASGINNPENFSEDFEEATSKHKAFVDTNPKDLEGNKKPPLSLIPPSALIGLAMAFKEGARKYGSFNWRTKKVQAMIYLDAAMRHILQKLDGEDIDPESGVDHLDAAMASLAIFKDAQVTGNLIDNRPTAGKAGQMIRQIGGKDGESKS